MSEPQNTDKVFPRNPFNKKFFESGESFLTARGHCSVTCGKFFHRSFSVLNF